MKNNCVAKPENREKVTYILCLYSAISRDAVCKIMQDHIPVGFTMETSGATKNLLFSWCSRVQTGKEHKLVGT